MSFRAKQSVAKNPGNIYLVLSGFFLPSVV